MSLHLLADDLTGALDSAAAFGAGVPVGLDRPPAAPAVFARKGEVPMTLAVTATASRDVPPAHLPALLATAMPWLAAARWPCKKVDSLLRGNTFHEIALLQASGRFGRIVMAPALPAQGRFLHQGRLWRSAPGASWREGRPAEGPSVAEGLRAAGAFGIGDHADAALWLPEVHDEEALAKVVDTALQCLKDPARPTLWCGSAGLMGVLAQRLGLAGRAGAGASAAAAASPQALSGTPTNGAAPTGVPSAQADPATTSDRTQAESTRPIWIVGATHQPTAHRQWQLLRERWPLALHLAQADERAWPAVLAALDQPARADAPAPLVALELSPATWLDPAAATALLQRQAQALVHCRQRPAQLLVLGGDTVRALLVASGAQALVTAQAARPGWGAARVQGGRWDGVPMASRSGAFGLEDDMVQAVEAAMVRARFG